MHRWNEILQRKGEEKSFHFPAIHNARFGIPILIVLRVLLLHFKCTHEQKG